MFIGRACGGFLLVTEVLPPLFITMSEEKDWNTGRSFPISQIIRRRILVRPANSYRFSSSASQHAKWTYGSHSAQTCRVRLRSDHVLTAQANICEQTINSIISGRSFRANAKCLHSLMASRGRLHWQLKETWLYWVLRRNEPAFHLIYDPSKQFPEVFLHTSWCSFIKLWSHLEWNRR